MTSKVLAALVAVAMLLLALPAFAADDMSAGPHTQTVMQAYGAYVNGDIDGIVALTTDDVDWGGFGNGNEGAPYVRLMGHEGVRSWFAGLARESAKYKLDNLEFSESGDTVTVTGDLWTTMTATGKELSGPFVHVFRFRGSKIAWFGNYSDSAAYMAALGSNGGDAAAQRNIPTIQRGYAAFESGDMDGLFACFTDDIHWESVGPADKHPLFGSFEGKAAVAGWFNSLVGLVDPEPFSDVQFVASGDTVVVTGVSSGTYKRSGMHVSVPFVHVMRFRDGKVYWFREQSDSYAEVAGYTGMN